MLIYGPDDYIFIFLLMAALVMATIAIPFYSFLHKGWKGLGLGCLFQPVIAVFLCLLVGLGAFFLQKRTIDRYHSSALAVVRSSAVEKEDTLVCTWYLQADGECLYESRKPTDDSTRLAHDLNLYDVVPLKSFSLCVEDHIVVHFNLATRTATATDFDEPIEVLRVDWPGVEAFFHEQ